MSTENSFCRQCGQSIRATSAYCPHCGGQQQDNAKPSTDVKQQHHRPASTQIDAVTGWSWGALAFGPIWGAFNKIKPWMSLLALLPITEIPMTIVLAIKGRQWSWESGAWRDIEHFNRVQKKWDRAGIVVITLVAAIGLAILVREINHTKSTNAESQSVGQRSPGFYQTDIESKAPANLIARQPNFSIVRLLDMLEKNQFTHGPFANRISAYLQSPDAFWNDCIASDRAYAQNRGGLSDQEALEWAKNSCTVQMQDYKGCIDLGSADLATMCFVGLAVKNAENGD